MKTFHLKIEDKKEVKFFEELIKKFDFIELLGEEKDSVIIRNGKRMSIRPGDPSLKLTDLKGIWKDRHDITLQSLRDKAWKRN